MVQLAKYFLFPIFIPLSSDTSKYHSKCMWDASRVTFALCNSLQGCGCDDDETGKTGSEKFCDDFRVPTNWKADTRKVESDTLKAVH